MRCDFAASQEDFWQRPGVSIRRCSQTAHNNAKRVEERMILNWLSIIRNWVRRATVGVDDYGRRLIDGYGLER
jgi:hypothetical protein